MKDLSEKIYHWEGLIFNLLCASYFAFLAPYIQTIASINITEEHRPFPWFGLLLIIISIAEVYALPKKMRYVHRALKEHGEHSSSGFMLWVFHSAISIIITFSALEAFGYKINPKGGNTPVAIVFIMSFLIVIKELYLLFSIMGMHDEKEELEEFKRPNQKEWSLDFILLSYTCLAYTITWKAMTANMSLELENPVMFVINCISASLLFFIFYLPIRIPYYIEETAQLKSTKDYVVFVGSLLVVLIAALAF